jgi:hypothetical protein
MNGITSTFEPFGNDFVHIKIMIDSNCYYLAHMSSVWIQSAGFKFLPLIHKWVTERWVNANKNEGKLMFAESLQLSTWLSHIALWDISFL